MVFLILILLSAAVAFLRGGSLRNLMARPWLLRWPGLVWVGLALQLALFTPFRGTSLLSGATTVLYPLSMLILVVWIILNRHLPGIAIVGLGLLSNTLAIIANGGLMPASRTAVVAAGTLADYALSDGRYVTNNSVILPDDHVRLPFLTDVFAFPAGAPGTILIRPFIFSVGDILIAVGVCLLVYRMLRPPHGIAPATMSK